MLFLEEFMRHVDISTKNRKKETGAMFYGEFYSLFVNRDFSNPG
jgi:hypothetical protein